MYFKGFRFKRKYIYLYLSDTSGSNYQNIWVIVLLKNVSTELWNIFFNGKFNKYFHKNIIKICTWHLLAFSCLNMTTLTRNFLKIFIQFSSFLINPIARPLEIFGRIASTCPQKSITLFKQNFKKITYDVPTFP